MTLRIQFNVLRTIIFLAIVATIIVFNYAAFAQIGQMGASAAPPNAVVVPWGDTLAAILNGSQQIIALLLLVAVLWVVSLMPSWIQDIVRPMVQTMRANQLFEKLAATVVGGTAGVLKGKEASIPIANQMVRDFVRLAIERGNPAVIEFAGRNVNSLAEKAVARFQEMGVLPAEYTLEHAKVAAAAGIAAASKPA